MIGTVLNIALFGAACVGGALVAEKQFATHESAADMRLDLLDYASRKIEASAKVARDSEDLAGIESAAALYKDVELLRASCAAGLKADNEIAASRHVYAFASGQFTDDCTQSISNELTSFASDIGDELGRAFGWIITPPGGAKRSVV